MQSMWYTVKCNDGEIAVINAYDVIHANTYSGTKSEIILIRDASHLLRRSEVCGSRSQSMQMKRWNYSISSGLDPRAGMSSIRHASIIDTLFSYLRAWYESGTTSTHSPTHFVCVVSIPTLSAMDAWQIRYGRWRQVYYRITKPKVQDA